MNNNKKLPVQADIDERDLRYVVIGTYAFAGLVGLTTLMSLIGLASGFGSSIIFGIISLIGGILYISANIRSAKAIAARSDPHFSFLVAGMNMLAFPFGTILSILTWRVLNRPSVRDIYTDPYRVPSLATHAEAQKLSSQAKTFQPAADAHLNHLDDAEEALWREMEKEHNKKKASETVDKIKLKPAND